MHFYFLVSNVLVAGNDIPTLRNVLVIIINIFLKYMYFNTILSMSIVS